MQNYIKQGEVYLTQSQFDTLRANGQLEAGKTYHITDAPTVIYFDATMSNGDIQCTLSQNNATINFHKGQQYIISIKYATLTTTPLNYNSYLTFIDSINHTINLNSVEEIHANQTLQIKAIKNVQKYDNTGYTWTFPVVYNEEKINNTNYKYFYLINNYNPSILSLSGQDLNNLLNTKNLIENTLIMCTQNYQGNLNGNSFQYKKGHTYITYLNFEGEPYLSDLSIQINPYLLENTIEGVVYAPDQLLDDVEKIDSDGSPLIPVVTHNTMAVKFSSLKQQLLKVGACVNKGKKRVGYDSIYSTNDQKPTKLYFDTSITPNISNIRKLNWESTEISGIEYTAFLMGHHYLNSWSPLLSAARQIYNYDVDPTLEEAEEEQIFCAYELNGTTYIIELTDEMSPTGWNFDKRYINLDSLLLTKPSTAAQANELNYYYKSSTDQNFYLISSDYADYNSLLVSEIYKKLPISTYSYAIVCFPNMDDKDYEHMIPIYVNHPFAVNDQENGIVFSIEEPGWLINEENNPIDIDPDCLGVNTGWYLGFDTYIDDSGDTDEGNGTWYYFEAAVEYVTKDYLETRLASFLEQIQSLISSGSSGTNDNNGGDSGNNSGNEQDNNSENPGGGSGEEPIVNSLTAFYMGDTVNNIQIDTTQDIGTLLANLDYGTNNADDVALLEYQYTDNNTIEDAALIYATHNNLTGYQLLVHQALQDTVIYSTDIEGNALTTGWQNLDGNNQITTDEQTITSVNDPMNAWNGVSIGNATITNSGGTELGGEPGEEPGTGGEVITPPVVDTTLDAPTNFRFGTDENDMYTLYWDIVTNADSYNLYINSQLATSEISTTYFDLSSMMGEAEPGTYTFNVTATGTGYIESAYSDTLSVTLEE